MDPRTTGNTSVPGRSLTTEVLTALGFLPRRAFLGAVPDNAHGADRARHTPSREAARSHPGNWPANTSPPPAG